jgi:hypothetical protein
VVYTQAGDARRRLFHQRALEVLAAAGESVVVLAHHALAAGQMQAAFRYSLAAGHEALRLSAVSEAIVHFERARQLVQDTACPGTPDDKELVDLDLQLKRAYELVNGRTRFFTPR